MWDGFMTSCASFLSSAVEPVASPEELQENLQEEHLLPGLFYQDLGVKHPGGRQRCGW